VEGDEEYDDSDLTQRNYFGWEFPVFYDDVTFLHMFALYKKIFLCLVQTWQIIETRDRVSRPLRIPVYPSIMSSVAYAS